MTDEKEFFELGKRIHDRLNPTPVQREWVETNNSACAILRQVHDMLALASYPPRKTWVGLTDEEIEDAIDVGFALGLDDGNVSNQTVIRYVRVIEAKLKEKLTCTIP